MLSSILEQQPALKLLGPTQLAKRLKGQVSTKDIKAHFAASDVAQTQVQPIKRRRSEFYKITALPHTYQLDLITVGHARANGGVGEFLLAVDILSRKAFAVPMKKTDDEALLDAYMHFLEHCGAGGPGGEHGSLPGVNAINGVQGDDRFASQAFKLANDYLEIPVHTGVAKEDHISDGNQLGIVDRTVRSLKQLLNRWMQEHDSVKWTGFLDEALELYNSTPMSTLDDRTPDAVFSDPDVSGIQKHSIESAHNDAVFKNAKHFDAGDTVRILEPKGQFGKEKARFSADVYTVSRADGFKYRVKDANGTELKRRFKSNELLAVPKNAKAVTAAPTVAKENKKDLARKKLATEGIAADENALAGKDKKRKAVSKGKVQKDPKPNAGRAATGEKLYEVEEILAGPKTKTNKETGMQEPFYKVKWLNYKTPTWQPASLLVAPGVKKLLKRYTQSLQNH